MHLPLTDPVMQFSIKHLLLTDAEALECAAVQILVWHASSCNRQTVALVITFCCLQPLLTVCAVLAAATRARFGSGGSSALGSTRIGAPASLGGSTRIGKYLTLPSRSSHCIFCVTVSCTHCYSHMAQGPILHDGLLHDSLQSVCLQIAFKCHLGVISCMMALSYPSFLQISAAVQGFRGHNCFCNCI